MAISPINFSRISQSLRSTLLSDSIRRSSGELFLAQTRIATGRRFVAPSEDPVAAKQALDLTEALARHEQLSANARYADNLLAAADSFMTEVSGLVNQAQTIASQDVSNLTSSDERAADAELIAAIRHQLVTVGNRRFNGKFIFGGRETTETPFREVLGGVAYVGDTGDLVTRTGEGFSSPVNIPGNILFGALSAAIGGDKDLTPTLRPTTRLTDVAGAAGQGIRPGVLVINEADGAGTLRVDLQSVNTLGEVVARINEAASAAGSGVTAEVSDQGIDIHPGNRAIIIADSGTGLIAADLGIRTADSTLNPITGLDLQPRVTMLTPVSDLAQGAAIDLEAGLVLTDGTESVTVDLSAAVTVQDIINTINSSGGFARARINEAGTGIELVNRVSGSALAVSENGGTTATDLGLRTLHEGTAAGELNFGRGIGTTVNGPDLRVTARNGMSIDVDLDGAATIGAALAAINDAAQMAGVMITASLAETGNGIRLVDSSGGTGVLTVLSLGESTAAVDLGFVNPAASGASELIGEDRSAVRPEGVLGALIDLEAALRKDDTQGISVAAERLETSLQELIRVHGVVGARSQAMRADLQHLEDASQTSELVLSQVRDLDYAEAATQLQSLQTQFQASLQTGSALLRLSLLDFLQ